MLGVAAVPRTYTFDAKLLDTVLGTAARNLLAQGIAFEADLLADAEIRLEHDNHDNWDGGQDFWDLLIAISPTAYFAIPNRAASEQILTNAITQALEVVSGSDFIAVKIVTQLEQNLDWRQRVRREVMGDDLTNQGRVRSTNVAAREHDGLLFRSRPEILVYEALKKTGIPFSPLAVILRGGIQYERVEPDFLTFRSGLTILAEVDGDGFHTETPARAHERLRFLTDEQLRLHRIAASQCDTAEKAREAVRSLLLTIDKWLGRA